MSQDYKYEHSTNKDLEEVITASISFDYFEKAKDKATEKFAKDFEIKGFRKGKVPKNVIEAQLGPKLYEEALNQVLPEITIKILSELKLEPITQLKYDIKKLDIENKGEIQYEATFISYPKIKLGNFNKIKVTKDEVKVTKEDIDKVVERMLEDNNSNDNKDGEKKEKPKADDKWAESLGMENIKTMDALREEIGKSIEQQRKVNNEEKYQAQVIEEAVNKSDIKISPKFVEKELANREKDYTKKIEDLGLKVEDFLRNQNTTLEKMRETWKKEIERGLASEFLLLQIVRDNQIKVEPEEIEHELSHIQDPKLKEQYSTPEGKNRVYEIILKQKALKFLLDQVSK